MLQVIALSSIATVLFMAALVAILAPSHGSSESRDGHSGSFLHTPRAPQGAVTVEAFWFPPVRASRNQPLPVYLPDDEQGEPEEVTGTLVGPEEEHTVGGPTAPSFSEAAARWVGCAGSDCQNGATGFAAYTGGVDGGHSVLDIVA